mmetsp:Transcript_8299/g.21342  ORF Transcript_8299/g.21342 Transcript_8299/m.21342 type:complete len:245 (+) Transcript_8299:1327-2061(+)
MAFSVSVTKSLSINSSWKVAVQPFMWLTFSAFLIETAMVAVQSWSSLSGKAVERSSSVALKHLVTVCLPTNRMLIGPSPAAAISASMCLGPNLSWTNRSPRNVSRTGPSICMRLPISSFARPDTAAPLIAIASMPTSRFSGMNIPGFATNSAIATPGGSVGLVGTAALPCSSPLVSSAPSALSSSSLRSAAEPPSGLTNSLTYSSSDSSSASALSASSASASSFESAHLIASTASALGNSTTIS